MSTPVFLTLIGLAFNFVSMVVGGVAVLLVILKFHLRQEARMTALEVNVTHIMQALNIEAPKPNGAGGGGSCQPARRIQ